MDRNELLNMVVSGTSLVRNFIAEIDSHGVFLGSYENWNDREVVGHIVGWMNYSADKLSCIKLGTAQSEEYEGVSSLDEINRILYEKSKGKSREEIESEYLESLGRYLKAIALYSNGDMDLDTFDTGFKMELWRYMLIDTVIHPVQHLMYQYLKQADYRKLAGLISRCEAIFDAYSAEKQAYRLSELGFDGFEFQEKLNALEKESGGEGCVSDFIRANQAVSS